METSVLAPAKINLTLHVTGRRSDGYHRLDSLVAFADIGDRLTVTPGDVLTVKGPFAPGVPTDDTNLIRRALDLAGLSRQVVLDKTLPHPAGIGGGSSDAAAALRACDASLSTGQLLSLGADLPVCLLGRAARMRGVGEIVEPVRLPPVHAVLVNPGIGVPTGQVFAGLSSPDNPGHPSDLPVWHDSDGLIRWVGAQRNDLEASARAIAPVIETVLASLVAVGAPVARMSGSGATCYGLWPSRAEAERAAAKITQPGWWVHACTLS
ncbi:MAG: 4-(cytidine 5'-diphospho)-2-C-methyl-D-erythritol kinase [Pseudomonadota bacterium]